MSADPIAVWKAIPLTRGGEPLGRTEGKRMVEAGDDLAAALEAERERVRRMGEDHAEYRKNAAAALEARDRRIAELEAGLRLMIRDCEEYPALAAQDVPVRARDLLAARAAGGEG